VAAPRGPTDKSPKRRHRRKPIDLKRVQTALGDVIEQVEFYVTEPAARGERLDIADLCKLTHALAQAASVFKTLTETSALDELADLKERIGAIESSRISA